MSLFYCEHHLMSQRLELSDFQPFVGQTYTFSRDWEGERISAPLVLTQVTPYELSKRDRRSTDTSGKYRSAPFSAFFAGSHPEPLPQGNYSVTHLATSEPMDIFITCRGPNEEGTAYEYEAVFG